MNSGTERSVSQACGHWTRGVGAEAEFVDPVSGNRPTNRDRAILDFDPPRRGARVRGVGRNGASPNRAEPIDAVRSALEVKGVSSKATANSVIARQPTLAVDGEVGTE